MTDTDLKQIGLPLGPRRIILNEFKKDLFRKVFNKLFHDFCCYSFHLILFRSKTKLKKKSS